MKRIILFAIIFILGGAFFAETAHCLPWPPEMDVVYIKFNYESGSTNDALVLKKDVSNLVPVPEWYPDESSRNENIAYIKSQSSRKIKVKFWIDRTGMENWGAFATASGDDIGDVDQENFDFDGEQYSEEILMEFDDSVPSSVGKRNFSLSWYGVMPGEPDVEYSIGSSGAHNYYTLFDAPKLPMPAPWYEVLNYACAWANGDTDADDICTDILDNGFSEHYTWNGNCHRLSSDFVRLVTSLGVSASQHQWASKNQNVGDMSYQRTKSIDPVGPTYGQGVIEWSWHQWAEAASSQRDPSTAASKSGNWGGYEDDLFTHYKKIISTHPYYQWDLNQSGQSLGCEAPSHRIYSSSPTVYSFLGPDR
jgi:hypothetical protein